MTRNTVCNGTMGDSLKGAWRVLLSKCLKHAPYSLETCTRIAALLYLIKKNTLTFTAVFAQKRSFISIEKEALLEDGDAQLSEKLLFSKDPFFSVEAENLSENEIAQLGIENGRDFRSMNFYSALPAEDPFYKDVDNALSQLPKRGVPKDACAFLSDIVSGNKDFSELDAFLFNIIRGLGREAVYLGSPSELYELTSLLVDFKGKRVLSLFDNGIIPSAKSITGYTSFTGISVNSDAHEFISLYLSLFDKDVSLKYFSVSESLDWTDDKYDVVISNPQFSMERVDGKSVDMSVFAMKKFAASTNADATLLAFVPLRVLFSLGEKSLRKDLIEKNYLDSIILFPHRFLYATGIPFAAIILMKGRPVGKTVRMVDASKLFSTSSGHSFMNKLDVQAVYKAYICDCKESFSVSREEIESCGFSFDVSIYSYKRQYSTFRTGFDVKPLSELLIPIMPERRFPEKKGKIVKISDIPNEWTNNRIDLNRLGLSDNLNLTRKLTCPALLLNTYGEKISLAWCGASESNPVFIEYNINAYSLDHDNIDIDYLIMEFSKKNFPMSTRLISNILPEIMSIVCIDFPPLDNPDSVVQQKLLFNEAKYAYENAKIREMGLQDAIERNKTEYVNEVRMRRHDMKPYIRQIRSCNELLLQYSNELSSEFVSILKSQNAAIDALSASLDRLTQEDRFGIPKPIDVAEHMRHFVDEHITDSLYSIEFIVDEAAVGGMEPAAENGTLRTDIAREDMDDIIQNVVSNAVIHGFTDQSRRDYYVRITLSVDMDRDMVSIEFRNNGNPLPNGMTKDRYGLLGEKTGQTAGSGLGGHRVKSIVEHYGGDFEISAPGSSPVVVRVYLPIYRG